MVIAQPVGYFERKWEPIALILCILLSLVAVGLSLTLSGVINIQGEEVLQVEEVLQKEEVLETSEPSLSPTFDPTPTLEIVHKRAHIRCGMKNSVGAFHLDLVSCSFCSFLFSRLSVPRDLMIFSLFLVMIFSADRLLPF